MTNALLVILIIILGIIAFVGLVILAIYSKFKQIAREAGFGDMKNVMKEIKSSSDADYLNQQFKLIFQSLIKMNFIQCVKEI